MKLLLALAVAVFSLFPLPSTAYLKGFNLGSLTPEGPCKSQGDWQYNFQVMQNLPNGPYTVARLFATSDCDALANAVPAAIATNTTILVGIWTQDWNHYATEKIALLNAIQTYGVDWIEAVAVGSEDLYRKETDAITMFGQIWDVRGMLSTVPGTAEIQVGHVDTWTAWVDPANSIVITACDFIGMDGYPYWQGAPISNASNVFWETVQRTKDAVAKVAPEKPVWITETGWPVTGANYGQSVPSIANAQSYWTNVGCAAFEQANTFWYIVRDYSASPSFGVMGEDWEPLIDMNC